MRFLKLDNMLSEPLLPKNCYICLEKCYTISPCVCQAPVHHKCLWQYNRKNGADKCTICREEFEQIFSPCLFIVGVIFTLVFLCVFYIVGGFVGEFVWKTMGMCVCEHSARSFIDVISSQTFAISSLMAFAIVGICIGGFRR